MKRLFEHEWGKALLAGAILFLVMGVALLPLFNGRIVAEDDVAYYYVPAFEFYGDARKAGESTMIAPIFSGFPLALSQVGGFLDPLNPLLIDIFPDLTAYHLRILLNYVFAGIFAFLFARSIGLSFLASIVAMFAFVTAQHIIPAANILRSNSYFLMPMLFYALHELSQAGRPYWHRAAFVLLGAGGITFAFLGGYTQLVLYSLIAAGAFTLFLLWRQFSWRFFALSSILFAGGALLAAPYIFAVLEVVSVSARDGGISWADASASGSSLARSILNLTINLFVPHWDNTNTLQSLYIGTLSVFFFFASWRAIRSNSLALFLWCLFGFALLASVPYPLFYLMHFLPVFEMFRFPPHWLLVASFAMSILAGIGFDRASEGGWGRTIMQILGPRGLVIFLALNTALAIFLILSSATLTEGEITRPPAVAQTLSTDVGEPHRVFNIFPSDANVFGFSKAVRPDKSQAADFKREYVHSHLLPLQWGFESVRGFDNLVSRRYTHLLERLDPGPANFYLSRNSTRFTLMEGTFEILGMMNVKYVYSIVPLDPSHDKDASLISKYPLTYGQKTINVYVYQNKHLLPRAYVPQSVEIVPQDENLHKSILWAGDDFSKRSYVECDACTQGVVVQPESEVFNLRVRNDSVKFSTEFSKDHWVVVSTSHYPGWKAYIDGKEAPIRYANYAYQGILVPAGEHKVELRYPAPYDFLFNQGNV